MGNPNSKKLWFRKFVLSIPSDVEKFAESNGEIIFEIRPTMARYRQKTGSKYLGMRKAL